LQLIVACVYVTNHCSSFKLAVDITQILFTGCSRKEFREPLKDLTLSKDKENIAVYFLNSMPGAADAMASKFSV